MEYTITELVSKEMIQQTVTELANSFKEISITSHIHMHTKRIGTFF